MFAGQFIFQWLSLLIFTLEYLSTEQEVRKVLGMPSTKRKREKVLMISITLLLGSVLTTFLICRWADLEFYNSWVSSLGEAVVAFIIFSLQGKEIQRIFKLIIESDLDLKPVTQSFC